jgi:hypothetical protein
MYAVANYKKSDDYLKLSEVKKAYAERLIREAAHRKSPREVNLNVLTEEDILTIKGKISSQ